MSIWMACQWAMLVLALGPALYFLCRWRDSRVMGAFCVIVLFGYLWAVGQLWGKCEQLYWRGEARMGWALLLCYLGMCAMGPACVYFAWRFAGRHLLCRDRRAVGAVFGVGAVFYLLVLSNGWHHLYYRSFSLDARAYGPAFYAFTGFSYGCFCYAFWVLLRAKWDHGRSPWLIGLNVALPVLGNTLEMILRDPARDIVPACYCAMLAVSLFIARRYQPVHLRPIAAKRVLDAMSSPVLVMGSEGYRNGAAVGIDADALADGRVVLRDRVYQCALRDMDGDQVAALTDVTEHDAALLQQRRHVAALTEAAQLLDAQRARLMELEPVAEGLAAERRRAEIMARLSAEVAEKLDALQRAIECSLDAPDAPHIGENRRLALDAFAVVRDIVSEYKRK